MRRLPKIIESASSWLAPLSMMLLISPMCEAIPAFSRQYATSCTTCHLDFPKLNDFGKAFKDAGFKFPKDDDNFLKVAPVMLGAPAQKDVFPKSVWPGQIPGMPPIGLRMNNFFQVTSGKRKAFDSLATPPTLPGYIPATDFETGLFSIFTAGNFGGDIAFWVDDDISVAGDNGAGGLGDGYLKFVNIGRVMKLPKDVLSLRAGQFELDLPFTQARSINLSPYDIYQESNIGAMSSLAPLQQNVTNMFTFAGAAKGIELSGGHNYGGYHYSVAVIDQNTSGVSQSSNTSPYVPTATGGSAGGVGFGSDSSFKNVYARFAYRFNLEKDKESRNAVQAAGQTGPRDHTFLNLGSFYMDGNSVQRFYGEPNSAGVQPILTAREPYRRFGGDFSFNYRTFNLFGLYMSGRDSNLMPVDANGQMIPLPLSGMAPYPVAFAKSVPSKFSGGFLQADYLILPWIMAIGRMDRVHSEADRVNALELATNTPYFGALHANRNRFTPGMQFLIHPNVKASFEYQFRPHQAPIVATDPASGFRLNTFLVGLEFVY